MHLARCPSAPRPRNTQGYGRFGIKGAFEYSDYENFRPTAHHRFSSHWVLAGAAASVASSNVTVATALLVGHVASSNYNTLQLLPLLLLLLLGLLLLLLLLLLQQLGCCRCALAGPCAHNP